MKLSEAMNLAAGLCHAEANRYEQVHKPTSDHWRTVAVVLQGGILSVVVAEDESQNSERSV